MGIRRLRLMARRPCECEHPPEDHEGGECVPDCDCEWMPGNDT